MPSGQLTTTFPVEGVTAFGSEMDELGNQWSIAHW